MFFVYVLYSKNYGRYSVGMSQDVIERLKQHIFGKVKSTKAYLKWKVIYTEDIIPGLK